MVAAALINRDDPQVQITFQAADLDPATYRITLFRTVDGVRTTVRASLDAIALGGWTGIDTEAPLGPVTYQAEMSDINGGDLGMSEAITITIPWKNSEDAWLSDPLDAGSARKVRVLAGAARAQSRPVQGSKMMLGTRVIAVTGQRGLLTGLDIPFETTTAADRDAITQLITQTGGLILVRTAPPHPLPRLLYCWASDPQPSSYRDDGSWGIATWAMSVDEMSEFEGPPAIAAAPWQLYRDTFPTWDTMRAVYPTWLEAKQNPPGVEAVPSD